MNSSENTRVPTNSKPDRSSHPTLVTPLTNSSPPPQPFDTTTSSHARQKTLVKDISDSITSLNPTSTPPNKRKRSESGRALRLRAIQAKENVAPESTTSSSSASHHPPAYLERHTSTTSTAGLQQIAVSRSTPARSKVIHQNLRAQDVTPCPAIDPALETHQRVLSLTKSEYLAGTSVVGVVNAMLELLNSTELLCGTRLEFLTRLIRHEKMDLYEEMAKDRVVVQFVVEWSKATLIARSELDRCVLPLLKFLERLHFTPKDAETMGLVKRVRFVALRSDCDKETISISNRLLRQWKQELPIFPQHSKHATSTPRLPAPKPYLLLKNLKVYEDFSIFRRRNFQMVQTVRTFR